MSLSSYSLKAPRVGFGEGVLQLGQQNKNVIVLGADITSSVCLDLFKNAFPDRFFSFGIAEQNITSIAAGLALEGKIPIFASYGTFSAMRNTDQIRISICYNNANVKIGGAHAGISVGPDGATHQALEDIAIMRVLPRMTVISPCDATQTKQATIASVEQINGPVYIRFGREPVPNFINDKMPFTIGKGQTLIEGNDVTIIATGNLVWQTIMAAEELRKHKINARVINIHTIKPIDTKLIINAAKETGCIVTAEEHQIYGGLGSAVAETISANYPTPIEFIGINNSFGESGTPQQLMEKYKLTSKHIIKSVLKVLKRKK